MTPEDRLREARKQIKLARASDLVTRETNNDLLEARLQLSEAISDIKSVRETVDDAEVIEE